MSGFTYEVIFYCKNAETFQSCSLSMVKIGCFNFSYVMFVVVKLNISKFWTLGLTKRKEGSGNLRGTDCGLFSDILQSIMIISEAN